MPKSAGILAYRFRNNQFEVFLVHPGGPYWAKKDQQAWSIPKGELLPQEDPEVTARREFQEETGFNLENQLHPLKPVKQPGGKWLIPFLIKADFDPSRLKSNYFQMEWPPRSGYPQTFPEVDKGAWFNLETARAKILKGQLPLLDQFVILTDRF